MDRATELEQNGRAWKLTIAQHYEEAIALFTNVLSQCDSMNAYLSRGTARLFTGDYKGAEADFRVGRNHPSQRPSQLINLKVGVALWFQGEYEASFEDWTNEILRVRKGEITHSEVCGLDAALLLWWAAAHPNMAHRKAVAIKELKHIANMKTCQRSLWPGSLAYFLLGSLSEEEILQAVMQSAQDSTVLNDRRGRRVHFYIGATYLDQSDIDAYRQHLQVVVSNVSEGYHITSPEYHLARYDLNNPVM